MKRTTVLIYSLSTTFIVALIAFCLWQFRSNAISTQVLGQKEQELEETKITSRQLKDLEKQIEELSQKELLLDKKIPLGEKQPLNLIQVLIRIAGEAKLRQVNFTIEPQEQKEEQAPAAAGSLNEPAQLHLEMSFEATFAQLLTFLEKLMNIDRLVGVEEIGISRKKEILPYQKIFLRLVTYTF